MALYDLESYVFRDVAGRYHAGDSVSAFDFFCIVIWKANRAKSRVARRLLDLCPGKSLDEAVQILLQQLHRAPDHRERLRLLLEGWGFLLPMASAILTVFYPEDFTIYDYRVAGQLGAYEIGDWKFDRLWEGYQAYVQAVREAVPEDLSLRDKDRVLWARSFRNDLTDDIATNFKIQSYGSLAEP